MRFRRTLDGRPLPGAGFDAFACGLLAMAGVVVGWTKVRQAVVVAWRHVVDRVGAREAAEVADVPVERVDGGLGAAGGLPVGGEPATTIGILPTAAGHVWASSSLLLTMDLVHLYNHGEIGIVEWANGLEMVTELAKLEARE